MRVWERSPAGSGGASRSVIRFRTPPCTSPDDLRSIVEAPVELSGDVATVTVDNPQRPLYRLTGWAEERGVVLDGLEAVHPTLEDIFLELTSEDSREAGGAG